MSTLIFRLETPSWAHAWPQVSFLTNSFITIALLHNLHCSEGAWNILEHLGCILYILVIFLDARYIFMDFHCHLYSHFVQFYNTTICELYYFILQFFIPPFFREPIEIMEIMIFIDIFASTKLDVIRGPSRFQDKLRSCSDVWSFLSRRTRIQNGAGIWRRRFASASFFAFYLCFPWQHRANAIKHLSTPLSSGRSTKV